MNNSSSIVFKLFLVSVIITALARFTHSGSYATIVLISLSMFQLAVLGFINGYIIYNGIGETTKEIVAFLIDKLNNAITNFRYIVLFKIFMFLAMFVLSVIAMASTIVILVLY